MSTLQATAQLQLRQFIEQIERLEEEKKAIGGDIKDKYLEAKATGFDVTAMRKIISLRKKSKTEREEEESILQVYLHALGMAGTPLDDWAEEQAAEKLSEIAREDGAEGEPKWSINGGPEMPAKDAAKELGKRIKARLRGQTIDLPESAEA